MPTKQGDDIQELKLDVGLIKNDIKTIKRDMAGNQKIIIDRMDNFAFESIKDHDRDVNDVRSNHILLETRVKDIEDYLEKNKNGIESSTKVTSGVGKLVFGAIILAVFAAILYFGVLVAPALGGAK